MKKLFRKSLATSCFWFISLSFVYSQSFIFEPTDTIEYEFPGGPDILLSGNLINIGAVDLNIDIIRAENNLPLNWQSYMCTDVCLSPANDSTRYYLVAGDTQSFHFTFIISTLPDTGNALVIFKNVTDTGNHFSQRFFGIATPYAGISSENNINPEIILYPNPVTDQLTVLTTSKIEQLGIYNVEGHNILSQVTGTPTGFMIDMSNVEPGTYFVRAIDKNGRMISKRVVKVK